MTSTPIISGIGINVKDMNQLERIDGELQSINSTLTQSEYEFKSSLGEIEKFYQMTYAESILGNGAADKDNVFPIKAAFGEK